MDSFDYFNDWNKIVRWVLFLPMFFIGYVISYYVGRYCIWYAYGIIGLKESSTIGFILYHFYSGLGCVMVAILLSVSCAPRGKIAIASVYMGIILILLGMDIYALLTVGAPNGEATWRAIYDYTLTFVGGLSALLTIIVQQSEHRLTDEQLNNILNS